MIFSVSNDGIQWTLDFGPDSVTIAVNDLDQNLTISSQEIPLAAWQLLLSQRQDFLNNHLARVPNTPKQEGTMEMREEVFPVWGLKTWTLAAIKSIRSQRHRVQLAKFTVGHVRSVQTTYRHPLFSKNIWRFIDGRWISWKPHCVGWRERQGKCSSSKNTRTCGTSQTAEKSCFWSKSRIFSWLRL